MKTTPQKRMNTNPTPGKLYVVATPIGNLQDITLRALETLKTVDLIAAEDTRHTRKLLTAYNISKPLISYHEHNEQQSTEIIIAKLLNGNNVALVSDSGTPCVSDPGILLVNNAHCHNIDTEVVPGPSAVMAAISCAGINVAGFIFQGFLSSKKTNRTKEWVTLSENPRPIVFFESPHRLLRFLDEWSRYAPERHGVVCKELTKIHETIIRGSVEEIKRQMCKRTVKGEFVIILEAKNDEILLDWAKIDRMISRTLKTSKSRRDAALLVADQTGIPFRKIYKRILDRE
ncbi:16S rRNA (cytidine(1402)-2'-O)-methyltransferase [bacterium]|nr:16S rRNA (cytidine(1402)-2'-O)-methyltransferase [candidate division CSSED10-310 bacterium]